MLARLRELEGERQQAEARCLLFREEADDAAAALEEAKREGLGLAAHAEEARHARDMMRVRLCVFVLGGCGLRGVSKVNRRVGVALASDHAVLRAHEQLR